MSSPSPRIIYSVIYSVEDGPESMSLLGQHPDSALGLAKTARNIVSRIAESGRMQDHKRTLNDSRLSYHYKNNGQYVYLCVADNDVPLRTCHAFLEDIEAHHLRTQTTSFKSLLKEKMAHFSVCDNDKISNLRGKVDQIKDIMTDNIEKVLSRGETLEALQDKVDDFVVEGLVWNRGTKKLKNSVLARNVIITTMMLFFVLAILVVIIIVLLILFCVPGAVVSVCK